MFTGLIEAVGRCVRVAERAPGEVLLAIEVPEGLTGDGSGGPGCERGDSVAINGCCLTATDIAPGGVWTFQAGAETLAKTNLGRLRPGDAVNLERALPASGRFGGHIVQGHVDGVGTIQGIERHGDWIDMAFDLPEALAEQLVPKGSVAVDGVSLTVVDATDAGFSAALIPHTLTETTLGQRRVGDRVNIETDILGKYVHRWLSTRSEKD